jgi:hypothetical protein
LDQPKVRRRLFLIQTYSWAYFLVVGSFLPFVALYKFRGHTGHGRPGGSWLDALHPADVVLISTAITAGAASDLFLRQFDTLLRDPEPDPRATARRASTSTLAIMFFVCGTWLFAAAETSQEAVVSAQGGLASAREMEQNQSAVGQNPQIIESNRQTIEQKTKALERAQRDLHEQDQVAWVAFGFSLVLGVITIYLKVFSEQTNIGSRRRTPDQRIADNTQPPCAAQEERTSGKTNPRPPSAKRRTRRRRKRHRTR